MSEWKSVERTQYLGSKREQRFKEWDDRFSPGNWRLSWRIGETHFDFLGACALYEDGYFNFLLQSQEVLQQLVTDASEVYDDQISNINSGFDYLKQETNRTHLQDIAIRRSLVRMGLWFKGSEPIRIRQELGHHPLSMTLSPGKVPFHRPDLIVQPELQGWWNPQTVESFYQSNRYLQAIL